MELSASWVKLNLPQVGNIYKITALQIKKLIVLLFLKTGVWVGIELLYPDGRNDGSIGGIRYFHCQLNAELSKDLNYGMSRNVTSSNIAKNIPVRRVTNQFLMFV